MARTPPHPLRNSEIERFERNLANWLKCEKGTEDYSRWQGMLESQVVTLQIVGVLTRQGAIKLSVRMWEARKELEAVPDKPADNRPALRLATRPPQMQAMLITGPAGVGKSHLLASMQAMGARLHLLDPSKCRVGDWAPPTEDVDAVVFDNFSASDAMPPVMVEAFEWCLAKKCSLILSVQAQTEAPSQPWPFAPAGQTLIHLVRSRGDHVSVVVDGERRDMQYDALLSFAMAAIGAIKA